MSESQVEKVRRYIANQQIRHKRVTFEEELRTLLQAHHIDFKPEYLLG